MATPRFAWGIDIGNRALKAVKLVGSAEGPVIDDYDVVEHDTILSASGDNREQLISTALATFVARHPGIEKGQVGVSVNGQRTFAKFIKLPPVEKSKIPEIVKFEAIQQIPFPLDDVEWAYHLFQDPESPDVEVGIFAMKKELVNAHIGFFTAAKLDVQAVQMSPLSVYNALYYDSRIKGTTMVVDVGAESTDLIIAEGEGVWLRSIPIGGNSFTEALTKPFKVDFDKAEELKRTSRTSKYSRQIVQHMRPVFADLVSEIQRSMGFYTSTHRESRIERVIALGNTFRLPGLQRYLQQNLQLEVKELDRVGTATIEDPNQAALLNENLLSSVGAYGLALQVMGQGKIASSLLPEDIRQAKMWKEKNKWFAAAAALFVAGTAVAYGSWYVNDAAAKSAASVAFKGDIDRTTGRARTLAADWDKVEQSGGGDLARIGNVEKLGTDRGWWEQINTLLLRTLPQYQPDVSPAFAAGDVTALKAVPRGDRKQVNITAWTSKYYPDLNPALNAPDTLALADLTGIDTLPTAVPTMAGGATGGGGVPGGANGAAPAGPEKHGFVLTLRVTTPNKNALDILNTYVNALKASPPTAQRPWKVDPKSGFFRTQTIGSDPRRMAELAAAYTLHQRQVQTGLITVDSSTGGGNIPGLPPVTPLPTGNDRDEAPLPPPGMGGIPGGSVVGGNGNSGVSDEAYKDPQLGEDVRNDTEAIVVLIIELNAPLPPAPAPAVAGKATASAAN